MLSHRGLLKLLKRPHVGRAPHCNLARGELPWFVTGAGPPPPSSPPPGGLGLSLAALSLGAVLLLAGRPRLRQRKRGSPCPPRGGAPRGTGTGA